MNPPAYTPTAWLVLSDYPGGTAVERHRGDVQETLVFTTTDSLATVMQWYDATYAPPDWHDNRGAPDLDTQYRSFTKDTGRKCSFFTLSLVVDTQRQAFRQTLTWGYTRGCTSL